MRDGIGDDDQVTENDLQKAIEEEQLFLQYQPKINLNGGGATAVPAVEALVRWRHPSQGVVPPNQFIPLAENSYLIHPLTFYVLRQAAGQARKWEDDGAPLTVAVNIAAPLIDDLSFPDQVQQIFDEEQCDPSRIILEVTESGAMSSAARSMDVLSRLRLKGCGLSIDDFGTGYSSLVQLHRMPFTELKVDKSFVMEIGDNSEAELIVNVIVGLARKLGLKSCAEGVEDAKTAEFLASLGCDTAQGFHYSRPVDAADVPSVIGSLQELPAVDQHVVPLADAKEVL